MNYRRIYAEFIADRRVREADVLASGVYVERHHIVPRSLGGGDEPENIIALTAEDHVRAHVYLAQIHGGKMWAAVIKTFGGTIRAGEIPTERQIKDVALAREKWAESIKGDSHWTRQEGYIHPGAGETSHFKRPEVRAKLSEAMKKRNAEGYNPMNNENVREKVSAARKGKPMYNLRGSKHGRARQVRCIESGIVFDTLIQAQNETGARYSKISECCNGKRHRAGGYHWEYVS